MIFLVAVLSWPFATVGVGCYRGELLFFLNKIIQTRPPVVEALIAETTSWAARLSKDEIVRIAHEWEHQIFNIGDPLQGGQIVRYHAGLNVSKSNIRLKDLKNESQFVNIAQSIFAILQMYTELGEGHWKSFREAIRILVVLDRYVYFKQMSQTPPSTHANTGH